MNEIAKITTTWTNLLPAVIKSKDEIESLLPSLRKEIAFQEQEVTLTKALNLPTIAETKKQMSVRAMAIIIREVILKTAKVMKYAEKMEVSQANTLAVDLIDVLKHESIEDIVLMFKWARQGKLGELKGRLDADTINSIIIPNYLDKKATLREKQYSKEKYQHVDNTSELPEKAVQMFDKILEKIIVPKEEAPPEKPAINHHQIYLENLTKRIPHYSLELLKETEQKMLGQEVYNDARKLILEEIDKRKGNVK